MFNSVWIDWLCMPDPGEAYKAKLHKSTQEYMHTPIHTLIEAYVENTHAYTTHIYT